jgi:hypothetical protein
MSSLSDYFENALLVWAMSNGAVTRPTAWHVALFTAAPSDSGGGTEVSGGGYARQAASFTISGSSASNTSIIDFESTGDWANITHIGIFDASTAGNLLWHGALASARDPSAGDIIRFKAGQLIVTLA